MRIYKLDASICFDTDDFLEACLMDEYAALCEEVGAARAAGRIARWLDLQADTGFGTAQLVGTDEIARRIREGEWRSV